MLPSDRLRKQCGLFSHHTRWSVPAAILWVDMGLHIAPWEEKAKKQGVWLSKKNNLVWFVLRFAIRIVPAYLSVGRKLKLIFDLLSIETRAMDWEKRVNPNNINHHDRICKSSWSQSWKSERWLWDDKFNVFLMCRIVFSWARVAYAARCSVLQCVAMSCSRHFQWARIPLQNMCCVCCSVFWKT